MNFFFDSIILFFLIASTTLAVGLLRDRKRPHTWEARNPKLSLTAFMLLCSSALLVFWGSFIEPRTITVNRVSIDLPNFEPTKPVRVALISDIHVGTYKKSGWVRRVSQSIIKEKPDLALLAGDFIVSQPNHAQSLSVFRLLSSVVRTYAVLGDHDYHVNEPQFQIDLTLAQRVEDVLQTAGVKVLHNQALPLTIHGATFNLLGLDDWLAGKTDMAQALTNVPTYPLTSAPKLVLIHNPDFILDPESKNADLILAGNTHGGQIRLPFIGPVARLPSALSRSFDEGLFTECRHSERSEESHTFEKVRDPSTPLRCAQDDLRSLFITSGISESGPRARLFNPPEIAILELY